MDTPKGTIPQLREEIKHLRSVNTDLLAAAKLAYAYLNGIGWGGNDILSAAIARAEGRLP